MNMRNQDAPHKSFLSNCEPSKDLSANMKSHSEAVKIITQQNPANPYLDLAKKSLATVPEELFMLPHIQHLYLEENSLKHLPDNFFDHLPNLQWLDLRNNQLTCLPVSVGRHQCIKNLLLEGNAITHLPLQMGMTKCLTGLNLRGNPLQMPPQHIVDQGVYVILSYLYQELQNRTKEPAVVHEVEKLSLVDEEESVSDVDTNERKNYREDRNIPSPMSDDFDLLRHALTPTTATLHKPNTIQELRGKQNSLLDGLRNRSRRGKELSLLELRQQDDQRKDQLQTMKGMQVAHADQRRKDAVALEDWRNETRRRQRLFPRSKTEINLKPAPYGTDLNSVQHHDELREEKVEHVLPSEGANSTKHHDSAKKQQPQLGDRPNLVRSHMIVEIPNRVNELDKTKAEVEANQKEEVRKSSPVPYFGMKARPNSVSMNLKEAEIRQRKKLHSDELHQKLRKLRDVESSSTRPQVQQSKELQRQLLDEKMSSNAELEYRFRAFTGDTASVQSSSNKTGSM